MITNLNLIDVKKIDRQIFLALNKTYLKALRKNTPGSGITSNLWDIDKIAPLHYKIVHPNGEIMFYLEEGTSPHVIKAKNKKFLKFKKGNKPPKSKVKLPGNQAFEKDGYIFAKMVYNPGFEGKHFIEKIINDRSLEKEFKKIIIEAF